MSLISVCGGWSSFSHSLCFYVLQEEARSDSYRYAVQPTIAEDGPDKTKKKKKSKKDKKKELEDLKQELEMVRLLLTEFTILHFFQRGLSNSLEGLELFLSVWS